MPNLQALNAEYLALGEAQTMTMAKEYEAIVDYMKDCTAIHHGEYVRTCYKPKLFTEEIFHTFAQDMRLLYGIFQKVTDAYFADAAYRALFGFDARTESLILRSERGHSLLPMARIDFFYNEETGGYKFCEFNTDGTSAMNEDRELHNAQRLSTAYRAFTAAHRTRQCELFDSWVATLCAVYQRARGTAAKPYVAIVDFLDYGSVNEFEIFRQHFAAAGCGAEVCDIRALHYDGKALIGPAGQRIDAVYRRAVTSDVLDHYEECGALLTAARDGNVLLVGDFHTQLVHNKTIFRVLHLPQTMALLNEQEQAYIRVHVPMTRTFAAADLPEVAAHKDAWILKPLDSYASRGVYAGVEYDEARWRTIVAGIPTDGSYLLQEFATPYVTENYGYDSDGTFKRNRYYNLTGLYMYDGVLQGVYSRVSLTPIISSQYSEKTLPTLLVRE